MKSLINKLQVWLQLVRFPNLLTVPGDPIAGFFLASIKIRKDRVDFANVLPAVFCSLMFYMVGLIWNDIADYAEDSAARAERPLPSGQIKRWQAFIVSLIFAAAGLFVVIKYSGKETVVFASVLLGLVFAYNFIFKRWRLPGSLNMGLCRGVSLLLGASVFGDALQDKYVLIAALGITLYIMSISFIASETMITRFVISPWLPAMSVLLCCSALFYYSVPFRLFAVICAALIFLQACFYGFKLKGIPELWAVKNSIIGFLRGLLLIQAGFCALSSAGVATDIAIVLIVLIPINMVLAKIFYST